MIKNRYQEIVPELTAKFGYTNSMMVPRVKKIVLNMGLGEALTNAKALEVCAKELMNITGQKPVSTKAKKAIASFKSRIGEPIGLKVTLRGRRMEDFLERLIVISLPRVRDFRGVVPSFDPRGNFNLGIYEYSIFPEVDLATVDKLRGLQITIVTTARDAKEAKALLASLGMPFRKETNKRG